MVFSRQFDNGGCAFDALCNHMHAIDDVFDASAFRQFHAYMAVPALGAGAGRDHIAHSREPREGLSPSPKGFAQATHLCQAAGNQCGAGIIARAKPVTHAHRDGDDVFQDAAQFATDDIIIRIDPE